MPHPQRREGIIHTIHKQFEKIPDSGYFSKNGFIILTEQLMLGLSLFVFLAILRFDGDSNF